MLSKKIMFESSSSIYHVFALRFYVFNLILDFGLHLFWGCVLGLFLFLWFFVLVAKRKEYNGKWQLKKKWMGGMAMGKCEDKQRKSHIAQIDYKHFQGIYGRLQLGDVYTCHEFLHRTCEFKEVDPITFFHKLILWFVNKEFGNPWQLIIDIIHKIPKMNVCNSR